MGDLNKSQCEAVTATEGYIRVIAGAGSGKTRAIAYRFAYLVNEIGVLPSHILCVTFTNKASNVMRQRIRKLTGDNDTGYICTFHSFCVTVLKEDAHAVQYPENFLVLDNADIDAMLSIIYEERGLTLRHMTFAMARDMIEMRKGKYEPQYYEDMITMPLDVLRRKYDEATEADDIIFYGYLYQEKKCFGLDYNDLITFTLHIFETNEAIRHKWQERLEYIMIDEFQDIDKLQYQLMEQLCGYHHNLFIVGDPDQTIYTWRGANVHYLLDFDKVFPQVQTIMMMENYRSARDIIDVANSLISRNGNRIEKDLIPTREAWKQPVFYHAKDSKEEAQWIVSQIRELAHAEVPLSDVAILYRSHFVSRMIEETFRREKIPYTIYSGVQFYNRAEIKDALSYLRLVVYKDDLSFARVVNKPKRNIGERRMRYLRDYAAAQQCSLYEALMLCVDDDLFKTTKARQFLDMVERFQGNYSTVPVSELLSHILDESGYERELRTEGASERLDNLAELKQSIYEYETTCGEESVLENYLSHIALFSNADTAEKKNAVKCMTIHAAKGLEFPYVFLCSLEEGVFPAKKTASAEGMEEERRLAFVAMTRAEKGLYLSDAEGLNLDGSIRCPSRFILDIDKKYLHYVRELDASVLRDIKVRVDWSKRFLSPDNDHSYSIGTRISHAVMGPGTITGLDEKNHCYVIQFDKLATPRVISCRVKMDIEK